MSSLQSPSFIPPCAGPDRQGVVSKGGVARPGAFYPVLLVLF